jgi:hypothetical protein
MIQNSPVMDIINSNSNYPGIKFLAGTSEQFISNTKGMGGRQIRKEGEYGNLWVIGCEFIIPNNYDTYSI